MRRASADRHVARINVDADAACPLQLGRDQSSPSSHERVQHDGIAAAVQTNAPAWQRHGKRARMMELCGFALYRVVRDEPGVPAASQVLGVVTARDVGFVLERHADRQSVEFHVARQRQVKDVLVVVVKETLPTHRLEVTDRIALGGDRLDPGDVVLQHEQRAQPDDQFKRQPRSTGRAGDIEEERSVRLHDTTDFARNTDQPVEILVLTPSVVIVTVRQSKVIRRRRHNHVDRPGLQTRQHRQAIAAYQAMAALRTDRDRPRPTCSMD